MELKGYKPAIGIECHVQLRTNTKLFASVGNDARNAEPNTLISHICLGMPGALPVLNKKVVEYAVKVAYAFHAEPQKVSYFERKHYFYPDLPKGYQITQLHEPIIVGGYVDIDTETGPKKVRLNRVQIEEDAGKNIHPSSKDYSLVDLNRAGTPLLEIVSEPDIESPAEAKAYARELYLIMRYLGVSDADMYHGNMRFDVNVSVSKDPKNLGIRTETKNLNSFRSVEKAVEYEIKRQVDLLEKGEAIVQETRGWDDAKQKTMSQRGKEEAHDYRYMPDPDLPPVVISDEYASKIAKTLPVMPDVWRKKLHKLGIDESQTEVLLEAEVDKDDVGYLEILQQNLEHKDKVKKIADWFVNVEIPLRREGKAKSDADNDYRLKLYLVVYDLVETGKLSSTNAKALITTLLSADIKPKEIEKYAEEQGFIQLTDESAIAKAVDEVIASNPKAVEDVQNGEAKAIGFLVGQVMKATQGKANPGLTQELIKERLRSN